MPKTPSSRETRRVARTTAAVVGAAVLALGASGVAADPARDSATSDESTSTAATASPEKTVETFHAGLIDIMKHAKQLGFEGRTERLGPLMAQAFDLDFMASKTVGRHWNKLSDADKQRWIDTFTRFTTANYAGRFTGYTGEKFVTLGVEEAPRDTRMVMTKIIVPDEDDVELNYRLIKRKDGWKVVDVFLNGTVSELALRRSEYSSALKRDGFDQLVASVETKIADLRSKGGADG
jgi:phospholipid transport system substrate-binding protein